MCDFRIREFGHPNFSHRYTVQCVLPINLYNQQIFTILWFWFLLLICANLYAIFQWLNRMLPRSRRHYINKRLNLLKYFKDLNESTSVLKSKGFLIKRKKSVSEEAKRQKRKFIDDYLKFDGVFILRMISMLTSELVGTELLHELWNKRGAYIEHVQNLNDEPKFQNKMPDDSGYNYDQDSNNKNVFFNNPRHRNETQQNFNSFNSQHQGSNKEHHKLNLDQTNISYHNNQSPNKFENKPEDKITIQQQKQTLFVQNRRSSVADKYSFNSTNISRTRQMRMNSQKSNSVQSENSDLEVKNQNDLYVNNNNNKNFSSISKASFTRNSTSESPNSKNVIKTKKVAFAASVNKTDDTEDHFNDIDDVFNDININNTFPELSFKSDKII